VGTTDCKAMMFKPSEHACSTILLRLNAVPLQANNTAAPATLSLAFHGLTVINGAASGNINLQRAVVSANNVAVNVGGGVPTIAPSLTGLLQVCKLCCWCNKANSTCRLPDASRATCEASGEPELAQVRGWLHHLSMRATPNISQDLQLTHTMLLQVLDIGSFFITPVNLGSLAVQVTGYRSGALKSGANVTLSLSTAMPHQQVFLPQPSFTSVDTVSV
jgi:hypothetical protein